MSSPGYQEELLHRWFPANIQLNERTHFSEADIRGIADVLRTIDDGAWSRIPRIYIVLRLIGRLDAISSFIQHECSDTWFPFAQRNLPEELRDPSGRSGFLEAQKLVCNTKALNLERADSRHGHFPDPGEIPLKKIGELGRGGSGFVDRVISTVSHREYALKLIKRGQTFRKDKQVLRNFEKELASLKRLSREHRHIIELIGSFTDPKYVGILFPVADCDLTAFMVSPDIQEKRWSIRPYFGCLVSALAFLHENNIRHKDIKPQNILIKQNVPYFTDFGLAVDWTDFGHSTTLGPTAMTPRYGAPEVAACEARNSSADIWSLGCVFLEMWAVLKGSSIKEVSLSTSVEGHFLPYHSKDTRLSELLDHVAALPGPPSDLKPLTWIQNMLLRERHDRWSAHVILEHIRELGADDTMQYLYVGRCCFEDEDTSESVVSCVSSRHEDHSVSKSQVAPGTQQGVHDSVSVLTSDLAREPVMRRRQSLQIMDLQAQLEQLLTQNRALEEAKLRAEESLKHAQKQQQIDKGNELRTSIEKSSEHSQADTTLEKDHSLSSENLGIQADVFELPHRKKDLPTDRTALRPAKVAPSEELRLAFTYDPAHWTSSSRNPTSGKLDLSSNDEWTFRKQQKYSQNSETQHRDRPEARGLSLNSVPLKAQSATSALNSSNTRAGHDPSDTDEGKSDFYMRKPVSAPILEYLNDVHEHTPSHRWSPSRKLKNIQLSPSLAPSSIRNDSASLEMSRAIPSVTELTPLDIEAMRVRSARRKADERRRSQRKEFLQSNETLVGRQEHTYFKHVPTRSPSTPPPPPYPPPRRRQTYTGSSTEAYSSLSDTPRTSTSRTTTRNKPTRRKPGAPEKKGIVESFLGRLRSEQDKSRNSRSGGKRENSTRDQKPQPQGSAKPSRSRPNNLYQSSWGRPIMPAMEDRDSLTEEDSDTQEQRSRGKQLYSEVPHHQGKKHAPPQPPHSQRKETDTSRKSSKPTLSRDATYVY